jgi:hypothetical protein
MVIVAAVNSFFKWLKGWPLFAPTQLALLLALAGWALGTAEANAAASDEDGLT